MKKLIIPALLALAAAGALSLGGCKIEDLENILVIPWKSEVKHIGMTVLVSSYDGENTEDTLYKPTISGTGVVREVLADFESADPSSTPTLHYLSNTPEKESVSGDTVTIETTSGVAVITTCIHGRKVYVGE